MTTNLRNTLIAAREALEEADLMLDGRNKYIRLRKVLPQLAAAIKESAPQDHTSRYGTNSGHGHVWERPDGEKARCGGPKMCAECVKDYAEFAVPQDYLKESSSPEHISSTANDSSPVGAAPLPYDVAKMVEWLRTGFGIYTNKQAADMLERQQAEIASANEKIAELEAVKKDAERYRYLKKELDTAIDSAMEGKK